MGIIITILLFAAAMAVLNLLLRRREGQGDFDPQAPSSAARPGMRLFFDFRETGARQRPPPR